MIKEVEKKKTDETVFFTRLDLGTNSHPMITFISSKCKKIEDRHIGNNLYAVFDTKTVKKEIKKQIRKYKDNNRMKPHLQKWKKYVSILEDIENEIDID